MGWNGSGGAEPVRNIRRKRSRGSYVVLTAGSAALLSAAVLFAFFPSDDGSSPTNDAVPQSQSERARLVHARGSGFRAPKDAVRSAMPKNMPKSERKERPPRPVELFEHLKGKDRKMAEAVQAALDAESFDDVVLAATESMTSSNPEVRQNAVEALGWFGAQALPELTGAMADADEDVRQAAENYFESAVQDLQDSVDQFQVAIAAFGALSDPDQLITLGGIVGNAAIEFIDSDDDPESAAENRRMVLQALVDVIESDRPRNVEAAKELYSDITGNEWLGLEEAQRYLDNPDDYDPDDRIGAL